MFSLAERSLYVADLDLWIDSMRPRSRCYVSHGHSDHAREHDTIVTTPANAKICRSRFSRSTARAKQTSFLPERPRPSCDFEEHGFNAIIERAAASAVVHHSTGRSACRALLAYAKQPI